MLAYIKRNLNAIMVCFFLLLMVYWTLCVRFVIPVGPSMVPTYVEGDKLLIVRYLGEPKVGDPVMLKYGDEYWIKRIYATAGDTVGEQQIPEGYVYVIGDNPSESYDSRDPNVGPIPQKDVWGKVILNLRIRR